MRKRLVQTMILILCLQGCYLSADTKKVAAKEPIQIVETTKIEPNFKILLENEVRYTRNWDEGCIDDTLEITYPDAQLLMMVASAEAGNQGVQGMLYVMETIINRVNDDSGLFPDTIQGVVYQKSAFETVTRGTIFSVEITGAAHEALAELEKNKNLNVEILGFETTGNGRRLKKHFDYSFTYLDHDFYTEKKN